MSIAEEGTHPLRTIFLYSFPFDDHTAQYENHAPKFAQANGYRKTFHKNMRGLKSDNE